MKCYLVGGAVRDQLLKLPVKERDWVVVGSTPEALLALHFKQVGKEFPVFLHPDTQEEYALARTERKSGRGYYGFICDFNPTVTLTEDLARRDLTINAMAMDEHGQLIDPFNGLQDLNNKLLRHVSNAFVEDPVRVLRVARFAARFHHLGFTLAPETRQLMYEMVLKGELHNLVAERVWQEWHKSLLEPNPEQFIMVLRSCDALRIILPELDGLFGVPNTKHYHPEVDSGIHTLMVLEQAVLASTDPIVRFASLLHDLGKALTPISQWPSHKQHETAGLTPIRDLCQRLHIPNAFKTLALLASEYHLLIHKVFELTPKTIVTILEKIDAFRRPHLFLNLLIVCKADALGRIGQYNYPQLERWQTLFSAIEQLDITPLLEKGYTGLKMKEAIHQQRVAIIKASWDPHET